MKTWKTKMLLPFRLARQIARGQLSFKLAWWLMYEWWPFKWWRRVKMKYRVWKARRYKGTDEFHASLDADILSMMEMTLFELKAYLADLDRRRIRLHEQHVLERRSNKSPR